MNLDIKKWKDFKVSSIFTIHNGKGITKEEIEENTGNFTVVQSGEENNGVLGKIDRDYCEAMNYTLSYKPCLTVARSGSAGFVSFQVDGCVVGDSAKILLLDEEIASNEVYTFLQTILSANRFKYAYGRKVTESKYMNDTIKLPVQHNEDGTIYIDASKKYSDDGYVPDWQWMENYIKSLHHKPLTTKNNTPIFINLKIEDWKEFKVDKLFRIEPTKGKVSDDLVEGFDVPYIGAKHDLNGLMMSCQKEGFEDWVSLGNCIVFIQLGAGSAGYANYIESDFIGMSGKTSCGYIDGVMNKYIGLFLATILCLERPKYSFGRSWTGDRLNETMINLPIKHNDDGTPYVDKTHQYSENGYVPDWEFMENYIKSLPYGDRI